MSKLDPDQILAILEGAGYRALYVGGYVRDRLLGLQPDDADIATSAGPDQIVGLFCDRAVVKQQGKHFGVVVVDGTEVAMFRGETYTIPGKPDVFPAADFAQDAARRDFTINAMGMTRAGEILDPVDGRADLQAGLIRAVGDPDTRFREDPARLLRAVTFAARLGFRIEEGTAAAIRRNADLLETLPVERMTKELKKMLDRRVLHRGMALLHELDLNAYVFPEGVTATRTGHRESWSVAVAAVAEAERHAAPRAVVLAAMAARWAADELTDTTYAERIRTMIVRLGLGSPLGRRVENLVRLSVLMQQLEPDLRPLWGWMRQVAATCRSSSELRVLVAELLQLQQAMSAAQGSLAESPASTIRTELRALIETMLDEVPWYPVDAGIDGARLGMKGPAVGQRVADLLQQAQAVAVARLARLTQTRN